MADLYLAERKRGAAGGNLSSQCVRAAWETSYQWKGERVMAEENCFKVSNGHAKAVLFSPPLLWPSCPRRMPMDSWLTAKIYFMIINICSAFCVLLSF